MNTKAKPITLSNGLRVLFTKRDSETCSIQVTVNVGSNQEDDRNRGISHFIEHMLFEGTTTRDAHQIAREVEGIGSEIGAFTSNERTCYYINCLKKHFSKGVEILADIIRNPSFDEKMIEKERGVILSEISMRKDEPRMYQWQLFLKKLYKVHPAKHPIIGYSKIVKGLKRKDLLAFFSRYYTPRNMIITVVGNPSSLSPFKEFFAGMPQKPIQSMRSVKEPQKTKAKSSSIKRKVTQSYMIVGAKTVPKGNKEAITLDIIRAILGKGLSGRLFNEVRTKRGLAYDVGVHHESKTDYGFFTYFVSCKKDKLRLCKNIYLKELKKLENLDAVELQEAKNFIEGEMVMELEDNHSMADILGEWAIKDNLEEFYRYRTRINKVTKKDILAVRDKYLSKDFVTTKILES